MVALIRNLIALVALAMAVDGGWKINPAVTEIVAGLFIFALCALGAARDKPEEPEEPEDAS